MSVWGNVNREMDDAASESKRPISFKKITTKSKRIANSQPKAVKDAIRFVCLFRVRMGGQVDGTWY